MMNWNYISGFFDADGSISLIKHSSENKTIQVSFHNTDLQLINSIRAYIERELGFRGSLATKNPRQETHSISYDLKYSYKQALLIFEHLTSCHRKKTHRIATVLKYYAQLTPRNGKYTIEMLNRRKAFERLFFLVS